MAAAQAPAVQRAPEFEIVVHHPDGDQWLARSGTYALAMGYIHGEIDVRGDMVEAVRFCLEKSEGTWRSRLLDAICKWTPWQLVRLVSTRSGAARDIQFHYDRSNDFYRLFLDSRMVYSCAYFRNENDPLEQAQAAKLDHICRKLSLRRGDRFLDIGCGWGAMMLHAAQRYGARVSGCTVSHQQFELASERMRLELPAGAADVWERDYRDVQGEFDKISSIGMFEHVGRKQLERYFRKVHSLLAPDGLFLNHGITRPASVPADSQSMFIARQVFPGSELIRLADVIAVAEGVGFEVLDVENLYRHYARTTRIWAERLTANRDECVELVGEKTWRVWQLYLAGCSVNFEQGGMGLHQVLLAKRGASGRVPWTREHIYQ